MNILDISVCLIFNRILDIFDNFLVFDMLFYFLFRYCVFLIFCIVFDI